MADKRPQISTTVSPHVRQLYDELCEHLGSGTTVLTIALRDLWEQELGGGGEQEGEAAEMRAP